MWRCIYQWRHRYYWLWFGLSLPNISWRLWPSTIMGFTSKHVIEWNTKFFWFQLLSLKVCAIFYFFTKYCTVVFIWEPTKPRLCSKLSLFKTFWLMLEVWQRWALKSNITTSVSFKMRYCMTLYLKGYQKYDKSKLKVQLLLSRFRRFHLLLAIFLIPFEV